MHATAVRMIAAVKESYWAQPVLTYVHTYPRAYVSSSGLIIFFHSSQDMRICYILYASLPDGILIFSYFSDLLVQYAYYSNTIYRYLALYYLSDPLMKGHDGVS